MKSQNPIVANAMAAHGVACNALDEEGKRELAQMKERVKKEVSRMEAKGKPLANRINDYHKKLHDMAATWKDIEQEIEDWNKEATSIRQQLINTKLSNREIWDDAELGREKEKIGRDAPWKRAVARWNGITPKGIFNLDAGFDI